MRAERDRDRSGDTDPEPPCSAGGEGQDRGRSGDTDPGNPGPAGGEGRNRGSSGNTDPEPQGPTVQVSARHDRERLPAPTEVGDGVTLARSEPGHKEDEVPRPSDPRSTAGVHSEETGRSYPKQNLTQQFSKLNVSVNHTLPTKGGSNEEFVDNTCLWRDIRPRNHYECWINLE